MVTPQKINEIKTRLKKGEPQGEIVEELINEGYTQEDIDYIFTAHKYDMRNVYLLFTILFLAGGAYNFITNNNYLLLIFSALMFFVYLREKERVQNN